MADTKKQEQVIEVNVLEREVASLELKRKKVADDILKYEKRTTELVTKRKESERGLREVNVMLTKNRKEVAELAAKKTNLKAYIEKEVNKEKAKLDSYSSELKQREMEISNKEQHLESALAGLEEKNRKLNQGLTELGVQREEMKKLQRARKEHQDREDAIALREQELASLEDKVDKKNELAQSYLQETKDAKIVAVKAVAIQEAKNKELELKINATQEVISQYKAAILDLDHREKAILETEQSIHLKLAEIQKQKDEIDTLFKSIESREFDLKVMQARISYEVRKRRLEAELKKE